MGFDAFIQDMRDHQWNVYGVEVYERGALIHAYGDTREHLHEIYSATKSVLSVAFGIARDRGLIDPDRPVAACMPARGLERLYPRQRDLWERLSLHRLLTMSVPDLPFRPEGENWLDFSLACPVAQPQRRVFHYNNICAYLVSVALTEALGVDLGAFVEDNVLSPLGIDRFEYARSPEGYFYGASGMRLTVRDLGRIGLMLSHGGVYDGKRIVSEEYVRMATAVQQPCREGGYGYFFWKYRSGFSINGKWGQKCYVLPDRDWVITFLSNIEEGSSAIRDSMERHLL